jgi:hypothetical protein
MLAFALLIAFAIFVVVRLARQRDTTFFRYATIGLLLHLVFAVAQNWVYSTYYAGASDVYAFAEVGKVIARALEVDFGNVAPEVVKMFFHIDAHLPYGWVTNGTGSTSTEALTGILFYAFDTSLLLCFFVVSIVTWLCQLLLARTLGQLVSTKERPLAYIATFLVPSVVFWSSGITKEAFVFEGLALLCFGIHSVVVRRAFWHLTTAFVGASIVGMIKAYTLFPFVIAMGVWVYIARLNATGRGIRILPLVAGMIVAVGGLVVVGRIFPQFSLTHLGEAAAQQQSQWLDDSNHMASLSVGSDSEALSSQLPYVPIALLNSLFRPVVFESFALTPFAASLETTTLLLIVLGSLWRFKARTIRDAVLQSPLMASSLAFTLLFGAGVGLVTKNLGSLSRYRMPMIPFYVLVVLVISSRLRASASERTPARVSVLSRHGR